MKHQLQIHIDFFPDTEELSIKYSYPFSGMHQLSEQSVQLAKNDIPVGIRCEIDNLLDALSSRILPPDPVRLPHSRLIPRLRKTVATIVIQDQTQPYPIARQYYLEETNELQTQIEKQIRIEPKEFSPQETGVFERLRQEIKAIVWENYSQLMGDNLFK